MTRKIARIQLRRGTSAQWDAADPVLAPGEMGVDLDTKISKIGDGERLWSELPDATDAASLAAAAEAARDEAEGFRNEAEDAKDRAEQVSLGAFFFVSETDTIINLLTNPNITSVIAETSDTYTLEIA